jgi:hypothetical protein
VNARRTITITATVEVDDLEAFLADDPDLLACVDSRFDEVFGDNGAVLSTVRVNALTIDGDAPLALSREALEALSVLLDVNDDDDVMIDAGVSAVGINDLRDAVERAR